MSRARKKPTPPREWGEWRRVRAIVSHATGEDLPFPDDTIIVENAIYNVQIQRIPLVNSNGDAPPDDGDLPPQMCYLSIRRLDRKAARDWRHLQRIKNELVGPECEFVELFPAESRLVDEANQTHLWGFASDTFRFPFGMRERSVLDHDPDFEAAHGHRQRPIGAEL